MDAALRDLLDLLDLEQIDRDIFRGRSPDEGWQRVYGGQVIGQALVAASRTVSEPKTNPFTSRVLSPPWRYHHSHLV